MKHDKYFQFPLCALSFGQTVNERLNAIIDHALTTAGMKLWCKLTPEQKHQFISEQWQAHALPAGFNKDQPMHCEVLYASSIIDVGLQGFLAGIERHLNLQRHVKDFESRHGRDALVRIKKSWVFKVRDGRGITYREFAVLCGIYSAIGDKELAIVTRERIRHCALGYGKDLDAPDTRPGKVKGRSQAGRFADLVALVRFALEQQPMLAPFADSVTERFNEWLMDKAKAGVKFSSEQLAWLNLIRDHIATAISIEREDLELSPFNQLAWAKPINSSANNCPSCSMN